VRFQRGTRYRDSLRAALRSVRFLALGPLTLGVAADFDDGDLWAVPNALLKWGPAVEKKIVEIVKAAVS